ncbi:MAG TPA: type IV toxin-antitoxin system AbiEi family antitoxin [Terriglobia bacterium]|nr:type IV toxin-antitoxin system AbiEi family antitoxin [Terriglobia bacterium]
MLEHTAEVEILERALNAFQEAIGPKLHAELVEPRGPRWRNAAAVVRLATHGVTKRFVVEVKRVVNPNSLGRVAEQVARLPQPALLAAEYVNPNMAERLKRINVFFLDTVGNAYLDVPGVFIYIKGQKPPAKLFTERPRRAFRQAGLKVIFALLCKQELLNAPYRTVAEAADVALGAIGWIFGDLERLGYLLKLPEHGRKLVQKEQLLERWVTAYPEQLRPKLVIGRYAAPDRDWWQKAHIQEQQAFWGGEIAAARLTQYLKPEDITIYVRGLPGPLLATHRLRKDARGSVEVLKAFWDARVDWTNQGTVHPILAYADLLRTGDARNLETARQLYDAQIARFVREH